VIDFQRISTPDCPKIEFTYLYLWDEPFTAIDARFIPVDCPRKKALSALRLNVYRLLAINQNIHNEVTERQIIDHVRGKIEFALEMGNRSSIFEGDITSIVKECISNEAPEWVANALFTKKKVEWKSNWRELIVYSEEETKKVDSISDESERKAYRLKLNKKKKMEYYYECAEVNNRADTLDKVNMFLNGALETTAPEDITYNLIAQGTGLHPQTLRNHLKKASEVFEFLELNEDARNKWKESNDAKIYKACHDINKRGDKITKKGLSEESGVSRTTIYKKWKSKNMNLESVVNSLNKKI